MTVLSLPEVIIQEEILPRLPVKSLLRFRCVSNSWRSLIGSKRFIKTQHQKTKTTTASMLKQSVILQNIGYPVEQYSLQSLLSEEPFVPSFLDVTTVAPTGGSFQVLGCYNGLVCVCSYPGIFYLWNPATRISKKLPEIANGEFYVDNCGFGWDESNGEYKVFAFVRDWDPDTLKGRVYSSTTKSWKPIEYNIKGLPYYSNEAGMFVGGKLHWRHNNNHIIFLDLKSELFGKIELPFRGYYCCFGELGGCLCVLNHNFDRDVRVWVMKEYGVKESWERLVNLSLDHELLQRPFSSSLTLQGSEGEIFIFHGSTFLVYNPRDNVFRLPKVLRWDASRRVYTPSHIIVPHSHHVYVESLLSPKDV